MKIVKDLLKGPGNLAWDLGRIAVASGVLLVIYSTAWNIWLGLPIDLGVTGLPGGLGAFFGGCAALIYAKDKAGAETKVANSIADCPPEPAKAKGK